MPEHRVPLLGESWRRHLDPESSRDPAVRAVVAGLRDLSIGPAPDQAFRTELRAQLVAITPRILAETAESETAMVDIVPRPVTAAATPAPAVEKVRRFRLGRVLAVSACVITAFALLLGGAVILSRRALPGDTLYGLKRASEQFQLDTDSSDTERASDLLSFAGTRADEVRQLISRATANASGPGVRADGGIDAGTMSLINSTLGSADSDVMDASRLLSNQAIRDGSPVALAAMTNWAPTQQARLHQIYEASSNAALRHRTDQSASLVSRAQVRAKTLISTVDCTCMANAKSDSLGPEPCKVCPTTKPTTPTSPTKNRAKPKPVNTGSPVTGTAVNPAPSRTQTPLSGVSTPTPGSGPGSTPPNIVDPKLPTPSVPLPVSVSLGSCGVGIGLLGIPVNVNLCKSSSGHATGKP